MSVKSNHMIALVLVLAGFLIGSNKWKVINNLVYQ